MDSALAEVVRDLLRMMDVVLEHRQAGRETQARFTLDALDQTITRLDAILAPQGWSVIEALASKLPGGYRQFKSAARKRGRRTLAEIAVARRASGLKKPPPRY